MLNVKYIQELIKNSNLTKVELTKRVGISRPALDRMLSGSDIRLSTVYKLSAALEVPVASLLSGQDGVITIHTSGPYSPGMMAGGDYNNGDPAQEIARLRKDISRLEEILRLYRRIVGDIDAQEGKEPVDTDKKG